MSKSTYGEKLKDPRWQKKRLEIFNRDNFTCRYCGDTESTLHVHHLAYAGEPWDVPNEHLITTCEDCHEADHLYRSEAEKGLLLQLKLKGLEYSDIALLDCAFSNLSISGNKHQILSSLAWLMRTPSVMESLINKYEVFKQQVAKNDDLPF